MSRHFEQLFAKEHATIMVMVLKGRGLVATALTLPHPTSAISRVWSPHVGPAQLPTLTLNPYLSIDAAFANPAESLDTGLTPHDDPGGTSTNWKM